MTDEFPHPASYKSMNTPTTRKDTPMGTPSTYLTSETQAERERLALPETTEGQHFGSAAFFSVRGRGFASLTKDGIVHLKVSPGDVDRFLADHPTGEPLYRNGEERVGVRVPLADINGKTLNAMVKAA
jgi:YjbR